MNRQELIVEHRKEIARLEGEAERHRRALAALEGTSETSSLPALADAPSAPAAEAKPRCNCADHAPKIITAPGSITMICGTVPFWVCPVHGLMPPVQVYPAFPVNPAPLPVEPWQPVVPWNPGPGLPWYGAGGIFEVHTDLAALVEAGFKLSIECAPPPFFPSGGALGTTIVGGLTIFHNTGAAQLPS